MMHRSPPHCRRGPRRWHSWAVPPFGLHRRIFWSLIGAMLVAGILAGALVRMAGPSGMEMHAVAAVGVVFIITLWFASGRLAFRLVAPLNRVVEAVQRFGQGDYSARAKFPAHRRDEVARVAQAIDDMADRIERQVKEERQLLAIVSHELRTPMSRIRILTELARANSPTALDDIDREVAEVDYLVANILARSRLEFGNLSQQSIRMVEAVREAMSRSGIFPELLKIDGSVKLDLVSADPTLLHRAISNLIDNAQRHGRGVAEVTVRTTGTTIVVEILDEGPGFTGPANDRFAAFSPEAGKARGSGLGLGLHLVKRIIAAHGGRVWAENRETGGARTGFDLPLTPPPDHAA